MAKVKTEPKSFSLCLNTVYVDKKEYKLTLKFLEQIVAKAVEAGQQPALTLGIKRNDKEMLILTCQISVEKKGHK